MHTESATVPPLTGLLFFVFPGQFWWQTGVQSMGKEGLDHHISEGGAQGFSKEGEAGLDSGDVLSGMVS